MLCIATQMRGAIREKHSEEGLKEVGCKLMGDCYKWRSCFWNEETKVLCIVYVDDFKVAGPEEAVNNSWADIISKGNVGIS